MKKNRLFKKVLFPFATLGLAFTLVGCNTSDNGASESSAAGNEDLVNISLYSSGSLNVKNFWETIIPVFEDQHPEIDVELVFVDSGTGGQSSLDRIIAAKQAGKDSEIDILEAGSGDIMRGKEEEIFTTLAQENIPNLERVEESSLSATENIGLPYRASSVVLAYNSEKVTDLPNTAEELYQWIKDNPKRFAYNDPSTGGAGESFVVTSIYNFLEDEAMNETNLSITEQWDEGFDLLKSLHPYLYNGGTYPKKNQGTLDLLANGEVDIVPAWSDMALEQLNSGLLPESIQLKQLDPPFTGGPTSLMLVENSQSERQEAAETFLDFVLTTEVQEIVVNKMYGYPGIKWEYLSEEMQENFESVSDGYRTFGGGSEVMSEMMKRWQSEVATQ